MSAADDTTPDVMSKGEALALAKVVRAQARVGARLLDEVKAERLAQLEAELGAPLFDRVGKTVRLTDAGQTFLGYARTLLATAQQAQAALVADRQPDVIEPGGRRDRAAPRASSSPRATADRAGAAAYGLGRRPRGSA